jgi:hypothetical protein
MVVAVNVLFTAAKPKETPVPVKFASGNASNGALWKISSGRDTDADTPDDAFNKDEGKVTVVSGD